MKNFLPFVVVISICGFLWFALDKTGNASNAQITSKATPSFRLGTVLDPQKIISENDLKGKITILNVWASWCPACQAEHDFWLSMVKDPKIQLIGLNVLDELSEAKNFLINLGNPYEFTIFDNQNKLGMDLGVSGTPETILLDKQGIIRYRYMGPMDSTIWQEKFVPELKKISG